MNKGLLKRWLECFLPNRLIRVLKSIYSFVKVLTFKWRFKQNIWRIHRKNGKAVVLMATPVHGNLGDHAIVFAERRFFSDIGWRQNLIEVPNDKYLLCKSYIHRNLSEKDMIVIDGGGNLGTLWPGEDDKISEIVRTYSNNPVIVFPQTCFYDGIRENVKDRLERNRRFYEQAGNLCITLRDKASYHYFLNNFADVKVLLVPDIVLYLTKLNIDSHSERKGIMLCLREDCEKRVSDESIRLLQTAIIEKGIDYRITSTVKDYVVTRHTREAELQKIWNEFASVRLVITDRLHAMIFSAITDTPCLAIDNVSKKLSGVNQLIADIPYIKVCDTIEEIMCSLPCFYGSVSCCYEEWSIQKKYRALKDIVRKMYV